MIDKDEFTFFVKEGWTVKELQEYYGLSRTAVYAYKSKWGLIGMSPNIPIKVDRLEDTKKCSSCNEVKSLSDFYSNGYQPNGKKKYKGKCKVCDNKSRYDSFKYKLDLVLKELGKEYKCEKCGYDNNTSALHFHHLDPAKKDFELSEISKTTSIDTIRDIVSEEIKKCIILCSNCHMEEHYPHLNKNSRR